MTTSKPVKRFCPKCQFEDESGLRICPRDGVTMKANTKDPLIGQIIDEKYEILTMLGKGGMSVVYQARHLMMNRLVAVKMLRPELVVVPQLLQRFKQESNAVSALRHSNIVTVYDYGLMQNGAPFLIMDYLEGKTLAEIIKTEGRMSVQRATPLFAQACDALAHSHDAGVIHRDIKPSNLLIRMDKSGEESLTIFDFGIAKLLGQDGNTIHKLTTSGEVFGSPLYMSPEQCSGEPVTVKADMYSVACVFYEVLTGQPPLQGSSPLETLMQHLNEDPVPIRKRFPELDIPAQLEDCIMLALKKDPADRLSDMREFRDQILEAGNLVMLSSSLHLTKERAQLDARLEEKSAGKDSGGSGENGRGGSQADSGSGSGGSRAGTGDVASSVKRTSSGQAVRTKRSGRYSRYDSSQENEKKMPGFVVPLVASIVALGILGGGYYFLSGLTVQDNFNIVRHDKGGDGDSGGTVHHGGGRGKHTTPGDKSDVTEDKGGKESPGGADGTGGEKGDGATTEGTSTEAPESGSEIVDTSAEENVIQEFNGVKIAALRSSDLLQLSTITKKMACSILFDGKIKYGPPDSFEPAKKGGSHGSGSKKPAESPELHSNPKYSVTPARIVSGNQPFEKVSQKLLDKLSTAQKLKVESKKLEIPEGQDPSRTYLQEVTFKTAKGEHLKEYFAYIKEGKSFVVCQFRPEKISEDEMVGAVKDMIPVLRGVVK